jgi:hypothetical protein
MMVITPKHVGAVLMPVLMQILKLFLGQFNCTSVGKQINFDNNLHVSDGLSVHHQESKTVHTASGISYTGSVVAC